MILRRKSGSRRQCQYGRLPNAPDHGKEIDQCDDIGQKGCDACAEDLIPFRKEHEHEQRIQDNIENTAHGNAEACLAGTSDCPQQLGTRKLQDGGNGSRRDHAQSILPGI